MKIDLNIHGVRFHIQARSVRFRRAIEREFRRFLTDDADKPHVTLEFILGEPPFEEIPPGKMPLFKTNNNIVYHVDGRRLVDHHGLALTIYDLAEDRGTIYAQSSRQLHQVAYLLILSRAGEHLDRRGLHRLHALAFTVSDQAIVCLADSGAGKTSLGLQLMRSPAVSWLADEIPLVDGKARIHPMPMPPRLDESAPIPWPAPPVTVHTAPRTKLPKKIAIDLDRIEPRIAQPTDARALFHLRRSNSEAPSIRPIGKWTAFRRLFRNAVRGVDLPQTKAYYFRLQPLAVIGQAWLYARRAWCMMRLARRLPSFEFVMTSDLDANSNAFTQELRRSMNLDVSVPSPTSLDAEGTESTASIATDTPTEMEASLGGGERRA